MIWRCPSSAALSHNPSWWCASFRHSFKSSYVITSVIAMFQRITQDEDMRLSFKCSVVSNCCWSSLDHGTFFNNIAFGVIWMCSFIYYLLLLYFSHCPLFTDSSFSHLSLPPADLTTACVSFSWSTVLPLCGSTFKECWEELMSFLSRISQTQLIFFFVWQSSFWNQLSHFKDHVYSSLVCWNEIRDVFAWKRSFFLKNQFFFLLKT